MLTLKQAIQIHGVDWLKKRSSDDLILIKVAHSSHSSKYLREFIPDIWGRTFVFVDSKSAREFLLSLEDVVRKRVSRRGSKLGSATTAIRFLIRFLIEENGLAIS